MIDYLVIVAAELTNDTHRTVATCLSECEKMMYMLKRSCGGA